MYSPALSFPVTSTTPSSTRRAPLKEHFVQVGAEILTGDEELSDGARLTYLVLLSFDYLDRQQGDHKGVVFPSVETLMAKRHKSRSTIYSHLAELEACGLIETIPGIGWRLYNAPERPQDFQTATSLSDAPATATDDYSAPESHLQTSLPSADRPPLQKGTSTHEFQKSGQSIKDEEEEITKPKQKQYSKAEEGNTKHDTLVVHSLQKFGFASWLANKFLQRYGSERVMRQVGHLEAQRKRGVPIQNCARWLYRAIECDYQFPESEQPQSRPKRTPYHIGALVTLPNGEAVYELIEQEKIVSEEVQDVIAPASPVLTHTPAPTTTTS